VDDMTKFTRKKICIDIDIVDKFSGKYVKENELNLLKALYQYSYINRIICETRHGYHVYLDIETDNPEANLLIRIHFGDDVNRIQKDYERIMLNSYINRCFTSSEFYCFSL
jgi:hypothetical protein